MPEFVPSIIVDLEDNYSSIKDNIVYLTPTPLFFETHTLIFNSGVSANTAPTSYCEMHLHQVIGRYPKYSTILQGPIS